MLVPTLTPNCRCRCERPRDLEIVRVPCKANVPTKLPRLADGGLFQRFGQAEIRDPTNALCVDNDVGGLDCRDARYLFGVRSEAHQRSEFRFWRRWPNKGAPLGRAVWVVAGKVALLDNTAAGGFVAGSATVTCT